MELVFSETTAPAVYRPRQPQKTGLYQLMEAHYEEVKALWEERFEKTCGRWRGFLDAVVARYLDCGIPERGFARVVCESCRAEFLLCFSCKARGLCPSCDAKRAAAFAAFLKDELLEDVGHALWTFSLPKMLRPYFLFHRELLTELARAAYETLRELMVTAWDEPSVRPGMVAVIQTFSDNLKWNPHLHCLVSRGAWDDGGNWLPLAYVDTHAAEILFREKVFRLLNARGLLSIERIDLLRSWQQSGFSVDNSVRFYPSDAQSLESVARYMLRCPLSLQRLHYDSQSPEVLYAPKSKNGQAELLDPLELIARLLIHVPQPNQHAVVYYGVYARRLRKKPKNQNASGNSNENDSGSVQRKTLRRRWADLIRRVFKTDPLICQNCGATLRIVSFITNAVTYCL